MRRTLVTLLTLAFAWGFLPQHALADDDEIFVTQPVEPNVMILIDTSGSMLESVGGTQKMTSAKNVVTNLLENVTGVRFGIFRFNDSSTGGTLVAECGSDVDDMIAAVDDLDASGETPLGRATGHVEDYFDGEYRQSVTTCTSAAGASRAQRGGGWGGDDDDDDDHHGDDDDDDDHHGDDDDDDDHHGDDDDDDAPVCTTTTVTIPSPIQYACQVNYAIVVTDGLPNGEAEDLVVDNAEHMFQNDHSGTFADKQNIIVHTVGFDIAAGSDLLTDAAEAGGGNFYEVSNEAQLQAALEDAVSGIVQETYSFTMPVVPATSVAGGANAYLASFEPEASSPFWPGRFQAYDRDADGRVPVDGDGKPLSSALVWDAGELLKTRAASTRTIYTVVSGALSSFVTTNATITQAMLGVTSSGNRTRVMNFIRGIDTYDHDGDSNTTEERAWKLGDIFHSTPALVFPPPLDLTETAYQTFKTANATRATILLAGANDGMLHAFRASDGYELWSVIPPDLLSTLKNLTVTTGTHGFFVDGTPVVADVKLSGTWKTIAVFGGRRGTKKYYALDITNTSSPSWLWSFSDTELGETWSEPVIGKIKLTGGVDKWVAFVGGGYDTASNNTTGKAFYVIDLSNGSTLWKYGPGGTNDATKMKFSVAATPVAVDMNEDGYVDRVYVGDVGGQLWKFDVSAVGTLTGGQVNNWTGKRLFVADTAQTVPPASGAYSPTQAMYATPALAYDSYGNLWVYIGSGDRNRPRSASSNYFYAIKDDTDMTQNSYLRRTDLVEGGPGVAATHGWYEVLDTDEKVLAAATVFNSVVYFTTYTPASTDVCDTPTGEARLYALDMMTGAPGLDFTDGEKLVDPVGTEPKYLDVGGGIPSAPIVSTGTTSDAVVVGTTSQEVAEVELPAETVKRLRYWREVY